MSPRWLMALLIIWLLNLPVNNWLEGDSFITSAQANMINNSQNYSFVNSIDADGVDILSLNKQKSTFESIFDAVSFNYSFFYDVDPITGDNTPNEFMYIRWFLLIMSIVIIIFCVKTLFFSL